MSITLRKPLCLPVIAVAVFLNPFTAKSQCTSAGPLSAGTAASVSFGGSNFNFSNVNNIFSSDNSRASSTGLLALFTGETEYLQATNFGFNIPPMAIICGIVVEAEKSATGIGTVLGIGLSYVTDHSVRLVRNGAVVGNNKASATHWTGTETYHSYGSNNDIWGVAWTPADINANNFGIAFSSGINGLAMLIPDVRIDHIRITVYYNVALLPVHIFSFNATAKNNNTALIDWKTPPDIGNTEYSVQRSRDGEQWENVPGNIYQKFQGGKIAYSTEDKQLYGGESFYRVRVKMQSGEIFYSPVKAIRIGSNNQLKVYPNPFTDRLVISGIDRTEKISITDVSGRMIHVAYSENGILDLRALKPGLYFLQTGNKITKIQKE
jgi:hypothetical protein